MSAPLAGMNPPQRWAAVNRINKAWLKAVKSGDPGYLGPKAAADTMRAVMADEDVQTDGHWPMSLVNGQDLRVIGCECGWAPSRRPERASMQHVPHQTHRRGLKLRPVDYAWEDDAYMVGLSGAGYIEVRNGHWDDKSASWVKDGTLPTITVDDLARILKLHEGSVIASGAALATQIFKEARGA